MNTRLLISQFYFLFEQTIVELKTNNSHITFMIEPFGIK